MHGRTSKTSGSFVIAYWDTVNGLRAGRSSVRTPSARWDFSLLQNISTGSVAHPAPYWIGTWVLSWVMLSGHEADYSPPPSAEVKDDWSYTSTSLRRLHSVDKDSWTLFFYSNQGKSENKLISKIAGNGLWSRVSLIEIYRWFLVEGTVAILTTEEPWNRR